MVWLGSDTGNLCGGSNCAGEFVNFKLVWSIGLLVSYYLLS